MQKTPKVSNFWIFGRETGEKGEKYKVQWQEKPI